MPDPTDGVGRRGSTDERIGQAEGLALGARRARADGGRSGTPERAGTHGLANDAPVVREAPEKELGDLDVRNRIGPVGEQERDLGGRETVLEVLEQRLGRLRGRRSLQLGLEVGEEDVVGEQRLPAAGDDDDESPFRRKTTDGAVKRGRPSASAVLPWTSAGVPAAERASASWRSYSATTSSSSTSSTMRLASSDVPASAAWMLSASSRRSSVVKYASCSARSAVHSVPGSTSPAATTARHPRPVPDGRRFGTDPNGIPYRSSKTRQRASDRWGSNELTAASLASSRRPIITRRQVNCSR